MSDRIRTGVIAVLAIGLVITAAACVAPTSPNDSSGTDEPNDTDDAALLVPASPAAPGGFRPSGGSAPLA